MPGKSSVAARTHLEKAGFFKYALLTLFTCLFFYGAWQTNFWLSRNRFRGKEIPVDTKESSSFRWHPVLFRFLSVGQLPAAVDALLLRFLTDDVLVKVKADQETELYRILDLATEIDPAFLPFYTAGSTFLAIARNDRQGALKLLQKGERFLETRLDNYPESFKSDHWPLRWRINFNLGYLHLVEFDDFDRAMVSYEKMGRYPDLPLALQLRAERVKTFEGRFRFALRSLEVLKNLNKDDPRMLEELEFRRKAIIENGRLWEWNRAFSEVKKKRRSKGVSVESLFSEFRILNQLPEVDGVGGRIFSEPTA